VVLDLTTDAPLAALRERKGWSRLIRRGTLDSVVALDPDCQVRRVKATVQDVVALESIEGGASRAEAY